MRGVRTHAGAGELHLTAVCMLAPHLTAENERELVESATHRRRSEIETMLALRFPLTAEPVKVRPVVRALPALPSAPAPARVNPLTLDTMFDASRSAMMDASGSAGGSDATHVDQAELSEPCGTSEFPSLQLGEPSKTGKTNEPTSSLSVIS